MMRRIGRAGRMRRRGGTALAVGALAVAGLVGCSTSGSTTGSSGTPPATSGASAGASASPTPVTGSITVFAASSLTTAFNQLGMAFETANPGAKVTFSYGGSATLAQQITSGAPADVFAAANTTTIQPVVSGGDASGQPTVFARNQLEIAVAPGNPKHIAGLQDLTNPALKVALCQQAQPCGTAASTVEQKTGAKITPVTLAPDVASALSDVELGEVDAALVYHSDVLSAGTKVTGVAFPESSDAINSYPIVVLSHSSNTSTAQAFVQFVLSSKGQAVLQSDGFLSP